MRGKCSWRWSGRRGPAERNRNSAERLHTRRRPGTSSARCHLRFAGPLNAAISFWFTFFNRWNCSIHCSSVSALTLVTCTVE